MKEISVLPGRVRLKVPQIYYNKAFSRYINVYIDNLYGVKSSSVNPITATILVIYDEKKTNMQILKENISNAVDSSQKKGSQEIREYEQYYKTLEKRNKAARNILLFGLTYLGFKLKHARYGKFSISTNVQVLKVASVVTIIGGYPLLKGLYKKFARTIPTDSDILLKLTASSFTLMRESSKGVMVLLLKALNDYIKYSADAEGQRLLRQSTGKTSGMAWLVAPEGQEVLVAAQTINADDIVAVHQGELVPAEGEVIEGRAVINSLYHTGQPIITHVEEGSRVYEGVSVLSGGIKLRVISVPDTNGKKDILKEELKIHKRVKAYQNKITPIALGASAVGFLLYGSTLNALSILLVLTPSAAGTALSTGMKGYFSLLNKHGIYLRNPNTFEKIIRTDYVVFDKTGTLTYGRMKIEEIEVFGDTYTKNELLRICAACEADNYHPVSITFQQEVVDDYDLSKVQSSVLIPSKGVVAQYGDQKVLIGSKALMEESGIDITHGLHKYDYYEKNLLTPVFVSIDGRLHGIFGMLDVLREDAYELIEKLKRRGMKNISLLTGDNHNKAQHIAQKLGIHDVYSECSYEDKVRIIMEKRNCGTVMMVGDGVNDALAMRSADISVSFANSSCDKVKLNSDCIVFEDNITRLADLISLSQKSYRAINQSITASQAYNAFFGGVSLLSRIDAFTAKSLNTVNSLVVLLLNKRIEYMSPGRYDGKFYAFPQYTENSLP